MTKIEHMPEGTTGAEAPKLYIPYNTSGVPAGERSIRPPEPPTPPEDPWLPAAVEKEIMEQGKSEFDRARMRYEHYKNLPVPLDEGQRTELKNRQSQAQQRMEQLERWAEDHREQPLREATKQMLESYKRIRGTRASELHSGGGREQTMMHEEARGVSLERLLEKSEEVAPLMSVIKGLVPYLWEGLHTAITYEEKGIDRTIRNPFAEKFFEKIKHMRVRDRMSSTEKKYSQDESWYGGELITRFLWAENPREMILTAMEWVKDRIAAIGERDPATTNELIEKIRKPGPTLLQNNLFRINSEPILVAEYGGEILETDPEYKRAIAFTEGPPDVFANEMIMKKGNTEFGPQAKERFAAKFIENFNAMYLENRYAAHLMRRLKTFKDGTYWTGHDWHSDKVEEGDIKDYREKIQEKLIGEAATQDFFTETIFVNNQDLFPELFEAPNEQNPEKRERITAEKREDVRLAYTGFFELREKNKLQYSVNDPLERLLLDPGDVIRQRIAATGDTEALRRHDLRVAVFRRTKEMLDRQDGFDFISRAEIDRIEKNMRRPLSDEELADLADVHKDRLRVQLKQRLTDPDSAHGKKWIEDQLVAIRERNRREAIRNRIREQIFEISQDKDYSSAESAQKLQEFDEARRSGDLQKCDEIAWDWVKSYNHQRIRKHLPKWYPSGWDKVRIKIDRAAKVIDRSLTEEEKEAMYETAYLPQGNDEEVKVRRNDLIKAREEDARFGFELARAFSVFLMEDTLMGSMRVRMVMPKGHPKAGEYIGRLADDETSLLLGMIREKINPQTGQVEKDANGKVIYETVDPDRKSLRVWDVVEGRLAKAIADEAAEIEPFRIAKRQALKERYRAELAGNQADIDAAAKALEGASKDLREKLRDSQFVATHALKAKGLVDGKLPVWSYNFLDNSLIKAFGEVMAEYGVEVAPGVPFADYKKEIYEYLERGRRALDSEKMRATMEFMEGRYPFYERDGWTGQIVMDPVLDEHGRPKLDKNNHPIMVPRPAVSIFTMSDDWGEPKAMEDRMRVVNKGPVAENAMITEAEYNMSTSGGVKFTEFIPYAGLKYEPLEVWLGTRDLNSYIKRRNEVEYHKQKFIDPTDMPKNARAQAAAYRARKALTGGSLGEGQSTPGFLNEPFEGAYTVADWLRGLSAEDVQKLSLDLKYTSNYVALMEEVRLGKRSLQDPEVEKARQLTWLDFHIVAAKAKIKSDEFYKVTYATFKNFVTWLKAEKEVEENRIGNAPRNYAYDNTKRWYAFRRLMRESIAKGERGFIQRLGYSPEIACEQSLRMLETGMMDAEYLILRDYERSRLAQEGALILSKVLNDEEKQKGRHLLNETEWKDQRPEVKKALETVRRRGLLEFMQEEGFFWYGLNPRTGKYQKETIKNLGEKMPELVRKEYASGKSDLVNTSSGLYRD